MKTNTTPDKGLNYVRQDKGIFKLLALVPTPTQTNTVGTHMQLHGQQSVRKEKVFTLMLHTHTAVTKIRLKKTSMF